MSGVATEYCVSDQGHNSTMRFFGSVPCAENSTPKLCSKLTSTSPISKSPKDKKTYHFPDKQVAGAEISSLKPHSNHVTFQRTHKVMYLGYAVLDKRYTQPMLPWVIAEIKRHGARNAEEIYLEVTEQSLKATSCESSHFVFEHKLQTISKFAQTSLDPTCFAYMTRNAINELSAYHVFQAYDECTVLELFTTVREVTKEMLNQKSQGPTIVKTASGVALDSVVSSCQYYEVLYLGKIKVAGKRAPPFFIDDAVEKFRIFEIEKAKNRQYPTSGETRNRHASGSSVSSLPYNFSVIDEPNENELQRKSRNGAIGPESKESSCESLSACHSSDVFLRASHGGCSDPFLQSPISPFGGSCEKLPFKFPNPDQSLVTHSQSMDPVAASQMICDFKTAADSKCNLLPPSSLITHTQSLDAPGRADIIRDLRDIDPVVILRDRVRSCSGDSPNTKQTSLPVFRSRVGSGGTSDMLRPRAYTSPNPTNNRKCNRTMLFLIGHLEICLIGMDKKQMLLSKTFNDIAHCSQGVKHLDHFGFICRETTLSGGDCYVGYIFRCQTEKVVDEMMQTLKQAFNRAHQDYQLQMHQKSPQGPKIEICDSCPMQWYHMLCSSIEGHSSEKTQLAILQRLGTLPDADKEEIMIKYQAAEFGDTQDQNEVLMMLLRNFCEQKQIKHTHTSNGSHNGKNDFTFLKEKSSKLGNLKQKAKKSLSSSFETILKLKNRDDVRERSATCLSDNIIPYTVVEDKECDLKDLDARSYREGSYDYSESVHSGRTSPFMIRPRSSTFGSSGEVRKTNRKLSKHESSQPKIPIMNIFTKTTSQNKTPSNSGDESESPDSKKGSWRQAIFYRVQTPVSKRSRDQSKRSDSRSTSEEDIRNHSKKSSEELRALWRKAILEQILLIRMEKENKKLQVSQDAATHKRMKLDYEEITPCLKEAVVKWEELLDFPNRTDFKVEKTRLMEIVKNGVPRHKRGEIWQFLAEQHCNFWSSSLEDTSDFDLSSPYDELLKQLTSHQHAILIDLGRTFPNHPFYSQPLGSGQLSLFNLLKAYSLLDKEVGYCQGLSFVSGVLLLHMPEDRAFLMMKHILFNLGLRKQYKPDMIALQIQMFQLSRLIYDNHRDLYDHLERYDIAPTLYAAPWFLTLFASQFPLGFVSRLFDLIFLQGMDIVFKVSLVLLGNHKEIILLCHGFESIMEFLKTSLPSIGVIQMERIFNQVFSLDIRQQLHAYEVEYHVLMEETIHSPSKHSAEVLKMEEMNKTLKAQNMELMDQLQVSYSTIHNLEASEASYKSTVHRLEARIRILEEEKEVLSHSLNIMRKRLQKLEVSRLSSSHSPGADDNDHAPTFEVVYAMAGSEREEEEQFRQLMRGVCMTKEVEKSEDTENEVLALECDCHGDDEENDVIENLPVDSKSRCVSSKLNGEGDVLNNTKQQMPLGL